MINQIVITTISLSFFLSMDVKYNEVETKLTELIAKTCHYKDVEKLICLMDWENEIVKNIPCISPLQSPDFDNFFISSYYGSRSHPITGGHNHHTGIDLPAPNGMEIYSPANGEVIAVGYNSGLGNFVRIKHFYGFETTHGHMKSFTVEKGQDIKIGDLIGYVGNTGVSTGSHLHYGVKKNGIYVDPYPYCYLYVEYYLKTKYKR